MVRHVLRVVQGLRPTPVADASIVHEIVLVPFHEKQPSPEPLTQIPYPQIYLNAEAVVRWAEVV